MFGYFSTKEDLVRYLEEVDVLKTPSVKSALLNIDRKDFLIDETKDHAYADVALRIGYGQSISQPLTVVYMLELLGASSGDEVLDLGSGSGWTTALLREIVGDGGRVVGLERIPALVEFGRTNVQKYFRKNLEIRNSRNGVIGIPGERFDRILVSAASEDIPAELLEQIKTDGVLVIPVGEKMLRIEKLGEDQFRREVHGDFVFVPLIR